MKYITIILDFENIEKFAFKSKKRALNALSKGNFKFCDKTASVVEIVKGSQKFYLLKHFERHSYVGNLFMGKRSSVFVGI